MTPTPRQAELRMNLSTPLGRLRLIGLLEGISCTVLFFVAMPLKYFADMPMAVTIVGTAHGVLWVAYILALLHVWVVQKWSFARAALFGFASLPPLVMFFLDISLKREQDRLNLEAAGQSPLPID